MIVKHANPCGVAVADDITTAYVRAHECDPVSAFGGIVAVNRPVTAAVAEAIAPVFTEVVVAPAFDDGRARGAARQQEPADPGRARRRATPGSTCGRSTAASWCRRPTTSTLDRSTWQVVTEAPPRPTSSGPTSSWPGGSCAKVTSQRHRAGQGRPGRRHRRRPAEPGRRGTDRRREGRRSGRRRGLRQRRVLPVPRRPRRRRRRRRARPWSSPAARSATTRSSPPPTSTASPWSSPASATSATERRLGMAAASLRPALAGASSLARELGRCVLMARDGRRFAWPPGGRVAAPSWQRRSCAMARDGSAAPSRPRCASSLALPGAGARWPPIRSALAAPSPPRAVGRRQLGHPRASPPALAVGAAAHGVPDLVQRRPVASRSPWPGSPTSSPRGARSRSSSSRRRPTAAQLTLGHTIAELEPLRAQLRLGHLRRRWSHPRAHPPGRDVDRAGRRRSRRWPTSPAWATSATRSPRS